MPFYSEMLGPNEFIIDEDTPLHSSHVRVPDGQARGYEGRDLSEHPYNSSPFSKPFDLPLIPRSEWDARIEEMEKTKSLYSQLILSHTPYIPSKNQSNTNYCWFNGVVTGCEGLMALTGQGFTALSSACGAAQIKGFRNQGGWGGEALNWMVKYGTCPQSMWPNAAINRSYLTEAARQAALKFRLTEWYDNMRTGSFDVLMTALFNRIPVPLGLDWWSHLICAFDPVKTGNNAYGCRIRNSWSDSWGEKGFGILSESRSRGDMVGLGVLMATAAA